MAAGAGRMDTDIAGLGIYVINTVFRTWLLSFLFWPWLPRNITRVIRPIK